MKTQAELAEKYKDERMTNSLADEENEFDVSVFKKIIKEVAYETMMA